MSFSVVNTNNSNNPCAICLAGLSTGEVVSHDEKIHLFHTACLRPWFEAQRAARHTPTCPLCRAPITHLNGLDLANFIGQPAQAVAVAREAINNAQRLQFPIFGNQNDALIAAVRNGDLEFVRGRLANGDIPEAVRSRAVYLAALYNNIEIARLLLENGVIPDADRGQEIGRAAGNGRLELLQQLIGDRQIPEHYLGFAIVQAAICGSLPVIETLLENGPISEADRGQAVIQAAALGHLAIIQALLANGQNISWVDRGSAVEDGAKFGHLETVQELLANGQEIPIFKRGQAVGYAASRGYLPIVRTLLANGPISQYYQNQAIICARENNHFAIINLLEQLVPMELG